MLNITSRITLNGFTELDVADFGDIYFYHFLDTGLPYGYFSIKDRGGDYIHKYENLQFGAKVAIELVNIQDESDKLTFPNFYILKVEDDFSNDPSKFSGGIRVWFVHPWFIFKDSTNHAYNPMNHGKLIRKILESNDRGLKFEINKDNFKDSDDSGTVSRYKTCETDWDFITNNLIPISTIGKLPPLFYCSLLKKKEESVYKFAFNFTNSAILYKQNPKIIITPSREALSEGDNAKRIAEICQKNNIDADLDLYTFQELKLKIMSEEDTKDILSHVYTEDILSNKSISLVKSINNNLGGKSGATFGNLLPIDSLYMVASKGTSAKIIKNRPLIDGLSLALSNGKNFDNNFLIIPVVNYVGDKVTIGDTIEFFVPLVGDKESWLGGKWLLSGIESYMSDEDPNKMLSKCYLTRPSFIGDLNKTSLNMYKMLLEV